MRDGVADIMPDGLKPLIDAEQEDGQADDYKSGADEKR